VLFAMGGYGTYLGFRIRFSDDVVRCYCTTFTRVTKTFDCFPLINDN
jgi:hypothetical protein